MRLTATVAAVLVSGGCVTLWPELPPCPLASWAVAERVELPFPVACPLDGGVAALAVAVDDEAAFFVCATGPPCAAEPSCALAPSCDPCLAGAAELPDVAELSCGAKLFCGAEAPCPVFELLSAGCETVEAESAVLESPDEAYSAWLEFEFSLAVTAGCVCACFR